jgi:hypothetical protein
MSPLQQKPLQKNAPHGKACGAILTVATNA